MEPIDVEQIADEIVMRLQMKAAYTPTDVKVAIVAVLSAYTVTEK